MDFTAADIDKGMTVYGATGDKIGSVARCWADGGAPAASAAQPTGAMPLSMGYLEVDQGGVLGLGAKKLYVPFSAVDDIVPHDNLTLSCAKDECDRLYGSKPAALDEGS